MDGLSLAAEEGVSVFGLSSFGAILSSFGATTHWSDRQLCEFGEPSDSSATVSECGSEWGIGPESRWQPTSEGACQFYLNSDRSIASPIALYPASLKCK
jgi:hypothetical protein